MNEINLITPLFYNNKNIYNSTNNYNSTIYVITTITKLKTVNHNMEIFWNR